MSEHRTADIVEINELTNIYARGVDLNRPDEVLSVFVKDGYWDGTHIGLKRFEGYDDMHAFFTADSEYMSEHVHVMTNHVVEFDGPDEAHGTHYLYSDGKNHAGDIIRATCLNEDEYRKVDGKWMIVGRTLKPLLTPEVGDYKESSMLSS